MNDYINDSMCYVITNACYNFNGGLVFMIAITYPCDRLNVGLVSLC